MELSKNIRPEDADKNLIRDLVFRYMAYWPLFLSLLILLVGSAWIYLQYATPLYETSATILIKDQQRGLQESRLVEQLDFFDSKKIVENEIEVLGSRSVIKEVVKRLKLYAPVSREKEFKSISAYTTSPVRVEAKNPESIEEQLKVRFSYDTKNGNVTINNTVYPLNQWVPYKKDTIRFIPNPSYKNSEKPEHLFFSFIEVKKVVADLSDRIKIAPANKVSSVITLKLKDELPRRGEDILNELLGVYSNIAIEDKHTLAANTLSFVEERLRYVVGELDSVESVMSRYKSTKGIVDISAQGKLFLQSVESNDQRISGVDGQLAVLDQVEKYVLTRNEKRGIAPSTVGLSDAILTQMVEKLSDFEIQYERLRKTTAENNPILVGLKDQIERLSPSILENIRNQRNNLTAEKGNINSSNNKYSSILRTIPQKERELLEISRQQTIKNDIYLFLLQRREETALSFASIVADSKMIDSAEASLTPVAPKKILVYLLAVLGAIALSIPIVLIKEMFNRSITSRSEIEGYVSIPIIGEISYDNKKNQIVIANGEKSFISEQFRQIRASLAYLGINHSKKKILITSSIAGDGKSFIAINLGISLALTDKKVVIVELDLRRPKVSQVFEAKDYEAGITDFLIGKANAASVIKSTEVNENLFFIPAGSIPPNPSELLLNGKIEELLAYLDENFDYVIIDTAPVYPVTDARILSRLCDATLYIIRQGYTPKVHIRMLEDNIKVMGLKNTAIIFNSVEPLGFDKNAYASSYNSYGYSKNGDMKKNQKALFS